MKPANSGVNPTTGADGRRQIRIYILLTLARILVAAANIADSKAQPSHVIVS